MNSVTGRSAAPRPGDAARPGPSEPPAAEPAPVEPRPRVPDARPAPVNGPGSPYRSEGPGPTPDRVRGPAAALPGAPDRPALPGRTEVPHPTAAPFTGARPEPVRSLAEEGIEPTTGAPAGAVPHRVPVGRAAKGTVGLPALDDDPDQDDNGDFWLPIEQVHWDGTPVQDRTDRPRWWRRVRLLRRRPARTGQSPGAPLPGLVLVLVLTLVASFFGWVSAEPAWLALGHSQVGEVVVTRCTGTGLGQRCRGDFRVPGQHLVVRGIRLTDVPEAHRTPGTVLPARMVRVSAETAYVDQPGPTRHLGWLLGLTLVLLCAAGVGWATGALRLAEPSARRWSVVTGFCGPLLIVTGLFLAAF